jgi:hypothetical protein
MERLNKNFDSLTEEAIDNVRADRDQTKELLKDLVKYLSNDEHRHKEVGIIAAKYVETLQRSNEQLVKIAALKQKEVVDNTGLTEDERSEIFDKLNEDMNNGS